ncbi:hypothetical protein HDU96_007585 [Phlyctochytrium bullatum]|nr:hypothetical protein HDU96_007585 [Phlyctochytrium bullatum]
MHRRRRHAATAVAAFVLLLIFIATATAQSPIRPPSCADYAVPRCARVGQIRSQQLGRSDLVGKFMSCGEKTDASDPVPTYYALCSVCPSGIDVLYTRINAACEIVGIDGLSGIIHYRLRRSEDEVLPTEGSGCPSNSFCQPGPVVGRLPFDSNGGFANSTYVVFHCYCLEWIPNGRGGFTRVPYGDSASFTVSGMQRAPVFDLETEAIVLPGQAHATN